ncbi:ComEA family DNA-binding protein [Sulfurimonas sp.]|uniref:ComEA family DNA-binding protein n=1 Tax=Sulfurimonas sp. TaxID=2022749 RepID=UPI003D0B41A9
MKFLWSLCLVFGLGFASVDINTANADSLASLKGVGEKKAKAIVMYRQTHGCFKNIDALQNVKGIGEKTIAENKSDLTASVCKK